MSKRSVGQLKVLTDQIIKKNDNGEITAVKDNSLRKNVYDSFLNIVDGGLLLEKEAGYLGAFRPTSPGAFATVDMLGAVDLSEYIKIDGSTSQTTGDIKIGDNFGWINNVGNKTIASNSLTGSELYQIYYSDSISNRGWSFNISPANYQAAGYGNDGDLLYSHKIGVNNYEYLYQDGGIHFDISNLTNLRTQQYQDKDGTFAYLDDITGTVSGYLPLTGGTLTGNLNGVTPTEITYISGLNSNVQNQINNINSGLSWKVAARVMSTANINISSPGASIDSVAMALNDRVVLNGQITGSQNGVYKWNGASVAMTRTADAVDGSLGSTGVLGMTINIEEGTYADQIWICSTNSPITIGTTQINFIKSGNSVYTGSNGIVLTGNNFTFDYTTLSATSPLLYNSGTRVFSMQVANTSQSGYLTSTDWNTFNNKIGAFANQNANLVYAGPASGAAAAPFFRSLSLADMPVFTGYLAAAGAVIATDTAFTAIQKLDGNLKSRFNEALTESMIVSVDRSGRLTDSGYTVKDFLIDITRTIQIDSNGGIRQTSATSFLETYGLKIYVPASSNYQTTFTGSPTVSSGIVFSGAFLIGATLIPASSGGNAIGNSAFIYGSTWVNNVATANIGSNSGSDLQIGLANSGIGTVVATFAQTYSSTNTKIITCANTGTGGTGSIYINPGIASGGGVSGNIVLNTLSAVNYQGMVKGLYGANATVEPTAIASGGVFEWNFSGKKKISGSLAFPFVGTGLEFSSGTNARAGSSTLLSGTVTVANTSITANSVVFLSAIHATIVYPLDITYNVGTGFTINSGNVGDGRTIKWVILEIN